MLIFHAHSEVAAYVDQLNQLLVKAGHAKLSKVQTRWLAFCLSAMVVTNSLCWTRFERASGGTYQARALAFLFRLAKISWDKLFYASVRLVLELHQITEGSLVTDDTDRIRSKNTKKIWGVHKIKDKKSGGFVMGQELVVLLLVTRTISLPVGFAFYNPDPFLQAWQENDADLKARGVKKADRPTKPKRDKRFPTKQALAMRLMRQFRYHTASTIKIKAFLADAAYMSRYLLGECAKIFPGAQVISQIKSNQMVRSGNRPALSAEKFFAAARSRQVSVSLRGHPPTTVTMASARLHIKSLGRKMLIVALKYEGEAEYRYLSASDLTWRSIDVIQQYSWRWIIEVFNQDWKVYEGWGQVALQRDYDGARNGVSLSMLLDHCLLIHSEQLRLARQAQPLRTVGSLSRRMQLDSLLDSVRAGLEADDPRKALCALADQLENVVDLRPSDKHLSGRTIEPFEPSPTLALRYRASG